MCLDLQEEFGPGYPKAIVLAKFLVYYAIPLVIIGLFYIMIAIHLAYGAGVPGEMQGAMRQVNLSISNIIYWPICIKLNRFISVKITSIPSVHIKLFGIDVNFFFFRAPGIF